MRRQNDIRFSERRVNVAARAVDAGHGAPPLRVAILRPCLGIGGAERMIVDAAVELQDRGHEVTMFNRGQSNPGLFPAAEEVRYVVEHSGATVLLVDPEVAPALTGVECKHRIVLDGIADAVRLHEPSVAVRRRAEVVAVVAAAPVEQAVAGVRPVVRLVGLQDVAVPAAVDPVDALVVLVVVDGPDHELPLDCPGDAKVEWVHRRSDPGNHDLLPAAVAAASAWSWQCDSARSGSQPSPDVSRRSRRASESTSRSSRKPPSGSTPCAAPAVCWQAAPKPKRSTQPGRAPRSSSGFARWTQSPVIFVLPEPSTVVCAEKLSIVANGLFLPLRACSTRSWARAISTVETCMFSWSLLSPATVNINLPCGSH